jgi:hypothetical protein
MTTVDYDIYYLIDLGFKTILSKRLCYQLGLIRFCPPCGSLDWYWSLFIGGQGMKIRTPKDKQEIFQLLAWFYIEPESIISVEDDDETKRMTNLYVNLYH